MTSFNATIGPTPFGFFDSDAAFQGEADAMVTYVKRKLGDDVLSVELTKKEWEPVILVMTPTIRKGDVMFGAFSLTVGDSEFAFTKIMQRAVHDQLVGHTARLRALAAVGAALAERFAREALAAVRHAERAVDEDFELAGGGLTDGSDVFEGELAGEDDAADAEALRVRMEEVRARYR